MVCSGPIFGYFCCKFYLHVCCTELCLYDKTALNLYHAHLFKNALSCMHTLCSNSVKMTSMTSAIIVPD